ncbi:MAG: bifunctional ornithine acetyltransferase/N-acetylglutamate synthase, partial [Candidatus Binatia bacterium]
MNMRVRRAPVRVAGFRFAGAHCGLKARGSRDIAVICSDVPAAAAAAFTTNRIKAAPVLLGIERMAAGRLQAIVANSGNANAFTGRAGLASARAMCTTVARALRIDARSVLPSSTGRIGVPLPRRRVERGIRAACESLSPSGFHAALEGIMTTDAFPKFAVEGVMLDGRKVTVAGMAKGAGMIAPRLVLARGQRTFPRAHATTLAYIVTDAAASPAALRRALAIALPQSFNAIVVDGDTSTNDTLILMANGFAGNARITPTGSAFAAFCGAVTRVLRALARL